MSLREDLRVEPISNLSLRKAILVQPSLLMRQAVQLMRDNRVGALIVVNDDGLPTGMFTEKLLIRVLVENPQTVDGPIEPYISKRVVCLKHDEPIARLILTMQEHQLRWVCVVDDDGLPMALAGLRGILEYVVDDFPHIVKVQPIEPKLSMQTREGA